MSRNGQFVGTFRSQERLKKRAQRGTIDSACVNAACNGEAVGRLWVRLRCSTESEGCFAARFVWILLLHGRVVALGRGRVCVIPGLQLKLPMIGLVIGPIIGGDGSELVSSRKKIGRGNRLFGAQKLVM